MKVISATAICTLRNTRLFKDYIPGKSGFLQIFELNLYIRKTTLRKVASGSNFFEGENKQNETMITMKTWQIYA